MTSSDAGATSSTISSPTAPSPMPMLSSTPSLTLSPVSTTSDNSNHRPFAGGLLRSRSRGREHFAFRLRLQRGGGRHLRHRAVPRSFCKLAQLAAVRMPSRLSRNMAQIFHSEVRQLGNFGQEDSRHTRRV